MDPNVGHMREMQMAVVLLLRAAAECITTCHKRNKCFREGLRITDINTTIQQ
jgi:hypothetical protein